MTDLRDRYRHVAAHLAPRAAAFLRWWRDGLLAWLPLRWRWALGWAPARLLMHLHDGVLQVQREVGTVRSPVATLPWPSDVGALNAALGDARLRRLPRHWLLADTDVLRRTLRLPAKAGNRLHALMAFEIDRQTPFAADQVSWDARSLKAAGEGQIEAELIVLPLRRLEAWRQQLGTFADQFAGIDVQAPEGPLGVNLLPAGQRQRPSGTGMRRDALLFAAALVFLVLAGNQILANRIEAADALRAQVESRARAARVVAAERAQLQALVDGATFIEAQRARHAGTLQVWNELSRLLPDGTYLEKLGIENDQVQLIGLSREANQLVPLLQASPLWRRVNLTGVLQADGAANGRDRFTLTAELVARAPVAVPARSEPATSEGQGEGGADAAPGP